MVSHRPRSEVERLPLDFEKPRKAKENVPQDFAAVLTLSPLTDDEQAARKGRALEVLASYHAGDLAEMLGLTGVPAPARPVSVLSVPCPQCLAVAGQPCVSAKSGQPWKGNHRGRQRRAAETRDERAVA